jgi:ribosomal protein S18 acetylase RimI-like enzyme
MIPGVSPGAAQIDVRFATETDRQRLANLIHFEMHVHRHLDWQAPLDWIGSQPFLVAVQSGEVVAALACPPDPPGIAWVRLFAAANQVSRKDVWNALWAQAHLALSSLPGCLVAAIPLQEWMVDLLEQSGFSHVNDVIILMWESGMRMSEPQSSGIHIRTMDPGDLDAVADIDTQAFLPLWRNSYSALKMALAQAAVATVALDGSKIVGYQISTASHMGGHIARLAVYPDNQGKNIGYTLVYDVLRQFERRMVFRVSVNTQRDNPISQSLYLKAGFRKTGESYLVYQIHIP